MSITYKTAALIWDSKNEKNPRRQWRTFNFDTHMTGFLTFYVLLIF